MGCISPTHVYTIPLPQLSKMYPKFSNIYVNTDIWIKMGCISATHDVLFKTRVGVFYQI